MFIWVQVFMIFTLKVLFLLSFVYCYQEGGQGKKYFKRWIGPAVGAALLILIMFLNHTFAILSAIGALLFLAASNSFSYGDTFTHGRTWLKILFRGLCGASWGLCGLLIAGGQGHWFLGAVQMIMAILGSVIFGVLNPFPESWGNWATRSEDICISTGYVLLIPFMV